MLKQLKRLDKSTLQLVWRDGHTGPVQLRNFRAACPCAGCKGETVLLYSVKPEAPKEDTPGRYELISAEVVGNYALQPRWGDGHKEGIYTWEQLRELCECAECLAKRESRGKEW